jgi:hypothetical protein
MPLPSACPSRIHLPTPLRSTPVTALLRYCGGSDSRTAHPPRGSPRLSRVAFPPFRLQPPCERPLSLYHATPHRRRFTGFRRIQASPFASRLARSPSRIEFVFLRTSGSPPVAPHPASLRRSYVRFRGRRACAPEGTSTPLTTRPPGRTGADTPVRERCRPLRRPPPHILSIRNPQSEIRNFPISPASPRVSTSRTRALPSPAPPPLRPRQFPLPQLPRPLSAFSADAIGRTFKATGRADPLCW